MTSETERKSRDWPVNSLLRQLRPEPGYTIERAVFASYSADLRVVAAVLLALTGSTQDPELGNRVRFAQALRRLRRRVAFVVQRGRIHKPKALASISGLLDRYVFEANCPEGAANGAHSWHPKFAIMKWRNEKEGTSAWRFWLGSRNLTRDLSRDVGLLLTEGDYALSDQSSTSLTAAVNRLQRWLPDEVRPMRPQDVHDFTQAKWKLPTGVRALSFHWVPAADQFPQVRQECDKAIVISPFVDSTSINRSISWMKPGVLPIVVAPEVELQRECPLGSSAVSKVDLRVLHGSPDDGLPYDPPPPPKDSAGETTDSNEGELDRSDEASSIHAKLIFLSSGKTKRLWLGSPNFTDRGWRRNYELAAQLEGTSSNSEWFDELNEIIKVCEAYTPVVRIETLADRTRDLLEQVRKSLCHELKAHQRKHQEHVQLHAEQPLRALPPGMTLSISSPWLSQKGVPWPGGATSVDLGVLPLEACTDFLVFELTLDDSSVNWIMRIPFDPPLADDRDNAGLYSYLGPAGFLQLIGAELHDYTSGSSPPWDAPPDEDDPSTKRATWKHVKAPTLEALLGLYVQDRARFADLARSIASFRQEAHRWPARDANSEELWRELDDFNRLWDGLGIKLAEREPRGT